jgi:hypothetical protein
MIGGPEIQTESPLLSGNPTKGAGKSFIKISLFGADFWMTRGSASICARQIPISSGLNPPVENFMSGNDLLSWWVSHSYVSFLLPDISEHRCGVYPPWK